MNIEQCENKNEYITTETKPSKSMDKLKLNEKQYSENNSSESKDIINTNINNFVALGFESVVLSAKNLIKIDKIINIILLFSLLLIPFLHNYYLFLLQITLKLFFVIFCNIDLDNVKNDSKEDIVYKSEVEPVLNIIKSSKKVLRRLTSSKVIDGKYAGGAGEFAKLIPCKVSQRLPFPFKTKSKVLVLKSKDESLFFLEDKLLLIVGDKIGVVDYLDIFFKVKKVQFMEKNKVPKDSKVIGKTWKYRNKNGTRDRRFKDNVEYPICLYGEFDVKSDFGLDISIIFSNPKDI
ncbi:DUF4236 domain-containing protein [bacterium]|nr:DUF4236 domain-containing protein [bacterium]